MNKLLAKLIKHGVAFHHAGVSNQQRQIIESGFRDRKIKIICATPTLAAGVNLPARRVVLSSYRRYDMQYGGMSPISVLDYKQMCGRAGRPQYDDKGETILIANDESEQDSLFDHYINGAVEDIESALSNEDSLRTHILATISSSKFGISKPNLLKLFNNTLYTLQNGNDELEFKVEDCVDFLLDENFIEKRNNKFISTRWYRVWHHRGAGRGRYHVRRDDLSPRRGNPRPSRDGGICGSLGRRSFASRLHD
uniref:Dead/deah box helicase domain-containing protein (HelS) n=1 Tax=uncultured marine thaumarchaeote AD1000_100_C06 TaxID=1455887 RepID=A0A075FHU1_9ARCH|nr:dead/deah box helicase domain-containing protein (helS) [uncultured marine thaumarchaeote AD1000_100_C06]